MSNHVRVPAGVREGGQFRAHARSEGSGLGALVCVECGGNLVVESDGVPAHVGLDGEPFTTDHDYRDRDELPDYGGATAFPDADVDETPPPVKDDYERDPEPLDYEFQLSAAVSAYCPICRTRQRAKTDDTFGAHNHDGRRCPGTGMAVDPHITPEAMATKTCSACGSTNADCGDNGCCERCRLFEKTKRARRVSVGTARI